LDRILDSETEQSEVEENFEKVNNGSGWQKQRERMRSRAIKNYQKEREKNAS